MQTTQHKPVPGSIAVSLANKRFPRSSRVLLATDYRRVFRDPKRFGDRYFTLLARPNRLGHARLGLAISKKHVRKAVERNRLKRLAREGFRLQSHQLPAVDLVIMAKPPATSAANSQLRASLAKLWKSVNRAFSLPTDS